MNRVPYKDLRVEIKERKRPLMPTPALVKIPPSAQVSQPLADKFAHPPSPINRKTNHSALTNNLRQIPVPRPNIQVQVEKKLLGISLFSFPCIQLGHRRVFERYGTAGRRRRYRFSTIDAKKGSQQLGVWFGEIVSAFASEKVLHPRLGKGQ